MDKKDEIQFLLEKMNINIESILQKPSEAHPHIREYITIYIENQAKSQQLFTTLCEHTFLNKLFSLGKHLEPIAILESFNLLLANISSQPELVYVFSQMSVHEYLFEKFNIFKETHEAVQYYVQLLKTIIMKLSVVSNNSLIKLFCNNRFSTFPLLTMVTLLGTRMNKEVLVRVTAHQCLLLLINLINQKQVGIGYLSEIQMVVFFFQICDQIVNEAVTDTEGVFKYLIDLIYSLRNNEISLLMLLNALCNCLILRNLEVPDQILQFLIAFQDQTEEHEGMSCELSQRIRFIMYRVLSKYLFNKFLNTTYFEAFLEIQSLAQEEPSPNLIKLYAEHSSKCQDYILAIDSHFRAKQEKEFIMEEWNYFNKTHKETAQLKETKRSKNNSFFSFFLGKVADQNNQDYLKLASSMSGVKLNIGHPLTKYSQSINFRTAVYTVEDILTTFEKEENKKMFYEAEITEVKLNESRGTFLLTLQWIEINTILIQRLLLKKYDFEGENIIPPAIMKGEYSYCLQLKKYLSSCIYEHLLNKSFEKVQNLEYYSKLLRMCKMLSLELDKTCKLKLSNKLEALHRQIQDFAFQNGFRHIIAYVIKNSHYLHLLPIEKQQILKVQRKKSTKSSRGSKGSKGSKGKRSESPVNVRQSIKLKMMEFEVIKKLINPLLPDLHEILQSKWKSMFELNAEKEVLLFKRQVRFHKNKDTIITLQPKCNYTFKVEVELYGQVLKEFEVEKDGIFLNELDHKVIRFTNCESQFEMKDEKEALEIIQEINRAVFSLEEMITMSVIDYLQASFEEIKKHIFPTIIIYNTPK